MATVREVTYNLLRQLGLTTIFGNPGSSESAFLDDFPSDFRYVLGLHEGSVLAMADGYAQASRRAAFVNLHTASGVGHAMGSLVTAYQAKTPLVVTAGQQVRAMLSIEPWLTNRDAVDLPKPYVKWASEPARAEDVPAAIERAWHAAMQAPQGPAFVSIPMDDWAREAAPVSPRDVVHRTGPDPAAISSLAVALGLAKRPALVAGGGIDRCGAWNSMIRLAERTRAGVWSAPVVERAGFPQDHRLFQGFLPPAIKPLADQLRGYDLVVVIGAPVFRYYPYVPGEILPEGTRLIQLTEDPDEAARAAAGDSIVGDILLAVERLVELVPASERPAPPPRPRPDPAAATRPMGYAFAMQALAAAMPEGTLLVDEAPTGRPALLANVPIREEGGYYATASGGLGFAVPAAVGVQLARPDRPVVCVVGDGAAMYGIQALWTAAREHAPVVYLVLDNAQYGILKSFAATERHARVPGLDLPGIDVCGLARAFGCRARRVEDPETLAPALASAFAESRADGVPVVIDAVMDPGMQVLYGLPAEGGRVISAVDWPHKAWSPR
jgi:benzoylformate decarboxylase